jgi:hypothetical protein
VTKFGHIIFCCTCWNSFIAFCPCLRFICHNIMAIHITTFWDGILLNIHHVSSMLLYFYIHVNKDIAHKDIKLTTNLNELFMNKHVVFKCSWISTCLHHLNKSEFAKTHSFSSHLSEKLHYLSFTYFVSF